MFPVFRRKILEGEQGLAILCQALGGLTGRPMIRRCRLLGPCRAPCSTSLACSISTGLRANGKAVDELGYAPI